MLAKKCNTIVDQRGNYYSTNAMTFSTLTHNNIHDSGVYNNNLNGEVKPPYRLYAQNSSNNEAETNQETRPSSIFPASPMSLGEHNGDVDDSNPPYNVKEVASRSHGNSKTHEDPSLVEELNWAVTPKLIISAFTVKTQDGNLNEFGANISTSAPHGRRCSEYYAGINKVRNMINLVNPNAVSIRSAGFVFMMNPSISMKDRYIGIVSNMIDFPEKGIFTPIRSMTLMTSMMTNHARLVANNYWLPRTEDKDVCLSAMD